MFCSSGQASDIYLRDVEDWNTVAWLEGSGIQGVLYLKRTKNNKVGLDRFYFHRLRDSEEPMSSLEMVFLKAWISSYQRGKVHSFIHASSMLDVVSKHREVKADIKTHENMTLGTIHENYVVKLNNNLVKKYNAPAWCFNRRIQTLYEVNL